jgi:membrane associated rhomboid family serine protease
MRYRSGHNSAQFSFGPGPITPGVKLLLIANVGAFLLTKYLLPNVPWYTTFGLVPQLISQLHVWQVLTYLFLHGGFWHLFMNMFVLWMFGVTLERTWGTDFFLKYYFLVGVGAGVATWLAMWNSPAPTIGASGATVGLLVGFAVMYPNQPILLAFLFPIPAKYFVLIYGALEFMAAGRYVNDGVAHVTHLAGMVIGFLYLRSDWRPQRLLGRLRRRLRSRRLRVVHLDTERRGRPTADEAEIDAILDKISREGIDSLTEAEVRKLRERSNR